METSKLENLEAIALIVLVMTNKIILNLPKTILSNTRNISLDKCDLYKHYCFFFNSSSLLLIKEFSWNGHS